MGCVGTKQRDGKENTTEKIEKNKFKVVLVGESEVGKSSLIYRLTKNDFPAPEVSEMAEQTISVDGKDITLLLFDTQGMEKFKTITSSFYDGSGGIMLVYDIASTSSFEVLSTNWFAECERYAPESDLILVGNKCDLVERQVTPKQLENLALSKGILFQEVSAKTGVGVNEAFQKLIKQMLGADNLGPSVNEDEEVKNGKAVKKKRKGSSDEES